MATRVGIELSPAACRVIEIEGGLPWVRRAPDTKVLGFDVLPPSGPETEAKLAALRKRSVAVVVWGVPSEHRQVIVSNRSYEAMRREALAALTSAGIETRGVLSDIAPAREGNDRSARRPVVVSLAALAPMTAALAPLTDAGIHVRSVLTPAAALASLARTRRSFAVPGSIEAYVALDKNVTCIALVRDGALITARELAWGYVDDAGHVEPRRLDDITQRLAHELTEFFGAIGASSSAVGQVCVCGGLPELRSMTARLTERLDIEVEPLDSLYGIDADEVFERADDFRERSAEMRIAWAAATDWPPAINLLRAQKRQAARTALARAAIAAGVVAGLGLGWRVQQSAWFRSMMPKPSAQTASNVKPPAPAAKATTPAPRQSTPTRTVAPAKTTAPTPPPLTATKLPTLTPSPPVIATKAPTPPPPPPSPVTSSKPSTPAAAPVIATRTPAPTPPPPAATKPVLSAPPSASTKPQTAAPPAIVRSAPAPPPSRGTPTPPVTNPSTAARREPERAPAPRTESRPTAREPLTAQASPPTAPQRSPQTAPQRSPQTTEAVTPPPARQEENAERARRAAPAKPPEVALPFDASLATILYSPDRKLAIIDGRIVGVGDEVRGARITEITASTVFLRDRQGKLRRLGQ